MKSLFCSVVLLVSVTTARAQITPDDQLPTQILRCGGSVITDIGPRLERDTNFSLGTSVSYKNGGTQVSSVSSDTVQAITKIQEGRSRPDLSCIRA